MSGATHSHIQGPMNEPLPKPFDTGRDTAQHTGGAPDASVRMQIDCRLAYQLEGDCEFVFLIHVALDRGQSLVEETLHIEPPLPYRSYTDEHSGNRFMRLSAGAGALTVNYHAVVDRVIDAVDPNALEVAVRDMPDDVLRFVLPTRYCESDLLGQVAQQMFGTLPGGHARVRAICDWVHDNVSYRIGSSNATTTARDVFLQRAGVCRDLRLTTSPDSSYLPTLSVQSDLRNCNAGALTLDFSLLPERNDAGGRDMGTQATLRAKIKEHSLETATYFGLIVEVIDPMPSLTLVRYRSRELVVDTEDLGTREEISPVDFH
jgi:hypothetical protein